MDYLTADQQARLECLKLLAPQHRREPDELLRAAAAMSRFVLEGTTPDASDPT